LKRRPLHFPRKRFPPFKRNVTLPTLASPPARVGRKDLEKVAAQCNLPNPQISS